MSYKPHLQSLVDDLKSNPSLIHDPSFRALRALFASEFDAKFPQQKQEEKDDEKNNDAKNEEQQEREENDAVHIDDPDVVGPESEPVPEENTQDPNKQLTDEEANLMIDAKSKASEAFSSGDYSTALEHYTKALELQPSALTFSKRAECFVKLKRNKAAKQDCEQALKINPDSAKALKVLGMAQRYLGEYEQACKNLGQGLAIDFDEQSAKVEKEAEKFFHEIRVAKSKEKAKREQEERRKMEERRKQAEEAMKNANMGGGGGGNGGGFPNNGFPGGMPPGMEGLMNDPEIMAAMMNPKVMSVLQQAQTNPGALIAAMNDPEVGPLLNKIVNKMGGSMGGGMGGGMPDFGNMGGAGFGGGASASAGNNGGGSRFTEEDAGPPRSATVDEVD